MDLTNAQWRKSSFSGIVAVRDSKDREGPALVFTPQQWRAFLDGVRTGEFSR
jgi:hypothetical protein